MQGNSRLNSGSIQRSELTELMGPYWLPGKESMYRVYNVSALPTILWFQFAAE